MHHQGTEATVTVALSSHVAALVQLRTAPCCACACGPTLRSLSETPPSSSFSPSSSHHRDAVSDITCTVHVTVTACVDRSFHSRPTSRLVHRWAHAYGSGEDQNLIQILIRIHQCTCGPVTRRDGARVSLQLWRGVSCRGVAWKN